MYKQPTAADHFADAHIDGAVIRWNSNNRVPPRDIIAGMLEAGLITQLQATVSNTRRDLDTAQFLSDYRRNYKGPSNEERFEARAAHGPGVTLVNVITGHKWTT